MDSLVRIPLSSFKLFGVTEHTEDRRSRRGLHHWGTVQKSNLCVLCASVVIPYSICMNTAQQRSRDSESQMVAERRTEDCLRRASRGADHFAGAAFPARCRSRSASGRAKLSGILALARTNPHFSHALHQQRQTDRNKGAEKNCFCPTDVPWSFEIKHAD